MASSGGSRLVKSFLWILILFSILITTFIFLTITLGHVDQYVTIFNTFYYYDQNETFVYNTGQEDTSYNETTFYSTGQNTSYNETLFYSTGQNTSEDDASGEKYRCIIPKLNPWDPSIEKYIKHPNGMNCRKVQPFMTYVDYNGYLRLNETETASIKQSFKCMYQTFDRGEGSDDSVIKFDDEIKLENNTKLTKNNVEVKCYYSNNRKFYYNVHAHPAPIEDKNFTKPTEDQLSVLFFLIDSVSYSAFQRNLPLTYNYTKNVMGVKFLKALNKVGDNSFPNQAAMFLGKRYGNDQDDMLTELHVDTGTYFDTWPFIWNLFAKKGYATSFSEDMPTFDLFHYFAKGFKNNKPFDYYYHYFWTKVLQNKVSGQSWYCFGNMHKAMLNIDLTKRQVMTVNDKLQFIFATISELPHDVDNAIEQADGELVKFWTELIEGNYLNKTAVIFASDHGIRLGDIRTTFIGFLEERLPFYGLWFPPWFYDKHPHIKSNIENNTDILSSSFDVYETLKDILDGNYNGVQRNVESRGQSHLYPLPKNRTCKSAGIANHFCTCLNSNPVPINDTNVTNAANAFVNQLNHVLKNVSDICHKIELSKILYITELDLNENVKNGIRSFTDAKKLELELKQGNVTRKETKIGRKFQMAIETEPNEATFEAMLKFDKVDNENSIWMVEGEISRTSKYAGLSDCIKEKYLRKYCSCKLK